MPLLLSELPPHSEELLVLAWNKINGCILQQRSKHEKKTHSHPDVYGFHVRHLHRHENENEISTITHIISSCSDCVSVNIFRISALHTEWQFPCPYSWKAFLMRHKWWIYENINSSSSQHLFSSHCPLWSLHFLHFLNSKCPTHRLMWNLQVIHKTVTFDTKQWICKLRFLS